MLVQVSLVYAMLVLVMSGLDILGHIRSC